MPTYESIGSMFRAHRVAADLSQPALANRTKVGLSTISRLEVGESVPRAKNLAKLAVALGIVPELLEAFGADVAADLVRDAPPRNQLSMRKAFAALLDAEVMVTKLGFLVELSQPEEGVLVLRCKQVSTPDEAERSALGSADRERQRAGQPPEDRRG